MHRLSLFILALPLALLACESDGGGPAADTSTNQDATAQDQDSTADTSTNPDSTADTSPNQDSTSSSGDSSPDEKDGDNQATFGTPCEQNSRVGHFQITHDEFYAAVSGTVAAGVIPLTILQPVKESGDCTMLRKVNPFCDPPCTGGDLCEHSGLCIPYPANQSVGTVSVTGLLKDPLEMEPNASNYYTDVAVPFPLFDPGAQVNVVAAGDALEGFALQAWGVPNVELPDAIWEMESGQPLTVEWDSEPGPWRMLVSLNVDQHGNSPVTMFCEVEDTGSAVVSAELVDELLSYGISGFATADFRRHTVDSLQLGDTGCVQLSVESLMLGKLTVAGHTPCKTPMDCPDGYECSFAIETCVEVE